MAADLHFHFFARNYREAYGTVVLRPDHRLDLSAPATSDRPADDQ
jgi:hypothetical protein